MLNKSGDRNQKKHATLGERSQTGQKNLYSKIKKTTSSLQSRTGSYRVKSRTGMGTSQRVHTDSDLDDQHGMQCQESIIL